MGTTTLTPAEKERWTHIGALSALAMLLGYLETFVPIPIPGVKLGLANVAVLMALAQGDVWGACWVGVIKVLAAGLLFGSPITMTYSAAGTALSLCAMVPLARLRTMRLWMVSVVGALAHEAGQLLVAQVLLGTPLVWYGAPPLLVAGCVTGLLCGVVAEHAQTLIDEGAPGWTGVPPQRRARGGGGLPQSATEPAHRVAGHRVDPRLALVVLVAFSLVTLRLNTLAHLALSLAVALCACLLARVRLQEALRAARPVAFMALVTVVAQVLSQQGGTPLCTLGAVVITREALASAAASVVRLTSLVAASTAFVHVQSTDDMLAGVAWLLAPLRRVGISVEGPLLALEVALGMLPLLAGGVDTTALRPRLDALPQLVANTYRMAEYLHNPRE